MPHSIRLRGPWEYQQLARDASGSDDSDTVRCTRRFHRPTGLTAESRVWLVIEDVDWSAKVELNHHELGEIVSSRCPDSTTTTHCPARFDITTQIQSQNVITITVTSTGKTSGPPGGLVGLVRLEIE